VRPAADESWGVTEPESASGLAQSALGGVLWSYSGAAVLVVAQVVSTMFTARLVSPAQFGAYASALALAAILSYLTFNSVGNALMRQRELAPRTIHAGLTLSLAFSAGAAALMVFAAGPWASLWKIPEAANVARVAAATLFFSSAASVPMALLRHALRFGTATRLEVGTQLIGSGTGIAGAAWLHTAIGLAGGQAVGSCVLFTVGVVMTRRQLGFSSSPAEGRDLVEFAGKVSLLNVGFFGLYNAPAWFTGRVFGASALGYYSRAELIAGLPLYYLFTGATKTLYPLYGRLRENAARVGVLVNDWITMVSGFVWPLLALLAGSAPVVVRLLLGESWEASAPLLRVLCLIGAANIVWWLLTNAAEAFAWMRLVAVCQIACALAMASLLTICWLSNVGLHTVLVGVALIQICAAAGTLIAVARRLDIVLRDLFSALAAHAVAALLAFSLAEGVEKALEGSPLLVRVCGQVLAAGVAVLGLTLLRGRYPAARVLAAHVQPSRQVPGATGPNAAAAAEPPSTVYAGVAER
jgi:O-antigen/teichoic acid export membrane protein